MPAKVKDTGSKLINRIAKDLSVLDGATVEWGWTETAKDYPDGTPIHMIAAVHQFGIGVPRRPILTLSFDKHIGEIQVTSDAILDNIHKTGRNDVRGDLKVLGQLGSSKLRSDFGKIPLEKLSGVTIQRKGHSVQLIETGHLKAQVDYKIRL